MLTRKNFDEFYIYICIYMHSMVILLSLYLNKNLCRIFFIYSRQRFIFLLIQSLLCIRKICCPIIARNGKQNSALLCKHTLLHLLECFKTPNHSIPPKPLASSQPFISCLCHAQKALASVRGIRTRSRQTPNILSARMGAS